MLCPLGEYLLDPAQVDDIEAADGVRSFEPGNPLGTDLVDQVNPVVDHGPAEVVVAGAALDIDRTRHMIRAFTPPQHWAKFQVMDWGYVRPYSIGWYCVVDGATLLKGQRGFPDVWLPDGALIRYREIYGWKGKPNEGCREESPIVVTKLLEAEQGANERMDYRVADTGMWAKNDGTSIYERMFLASGRKFNPRQSIKDRAASYAEVCTRLRGEDNEDGLFVPMFYITDNCTQFWRTVPPLVLDELHPEKGPDEKQENHVWDEVCYACMSRPFIRTKDQRIINEFHRKRRENNMVKEDPYRVKKLRKPRK